VLVVGDRADFDDERQVGQDGVDAADPPVEGLAAADLVAESGPAAVSISAIGKQLGVSGPALYRYFASRDELLTELVIDAYHDPADALAASHATGPDPRPPRGAWPAPTGRGPWPSRTGTSSCSDRRCPRYDAHAQRLVDAAQRAMDQLLDVLRESGDDTREPPADPLASQLAAWAQPHVPGIGPAAALRAVLIWSQLHGIVSLEIAGNWASIGIDPDRLFETQLAALTAGQ
jgi:AcrR family transcriptional regulator